MEMEREKMTDLSKKKDDIIKVLFYFNFIILIITIFYGGMGMKLYVLINFVFLGAFLILKKYPSFFESRKSKTFKKLNNSLEKVHG